MKGIIMLIVVSGILWGTWMSYQWLRNPENRKTKSKKRK